MSDGCVTSRFKMLTYSRVRSAFEATQALPSNMICGLKTRFDSIKILIDFCFKSCFFSAAGGLSFLVSIRETRKNKKILLILPASPKL